MHIDWKTTAFVVGLIGFFCIVAYVAGLNYHPSGQPFTPAVRYPLR
jgi:hypothetical protein